MSYEDPATPASNPSTMTKLVSIALGAGVAVVAFASCRKPPPDELVYTGASRPAGTTSGTGGAGAAGGTAPAAGTAGSSGGSRARGGSGGTGAMVSQGGIDHGGAGEAGAGGEAGNPPEPEPACDPVPVHDQLFTKRLLLQASGECAALKYCEFQEHAERLRDRTLSAAGDASDEATSAARSAWREAIAAWQRAELFQFGPAALAVVDPGGQGLRDHLYSWPLSPSCKVAEQLVNRFYEQPAFFGVQADSSVTGRSLHALEYLLFYTGQDNGCTPYSSINTSGSWAALASSGELPERRRAYAARAAEDVLRHTEALRAAWEPSSGDFRARLLGDRSLYASEQAALNAVSNALFYVEKQLKDLKLGLPLGLLPECPLPRCPSAVESSYARDSVSHLARNLEGFRSLFQGCADDGEGVGFDDWLVAVGAGDLSSRMLDALSGAEAAVASLDAPLDDLIVSDPARVEAVHAAVKRLTDPLKTEFVTTLNLELPMGSEGDND